MDGDASGAWRRMTLKYRLHDDFKSRRVNRNDLPHDGVVQSKILIPDLVAGGFDGGPRFVGKISEPCIGDVAHRP